MTTGCVCVWVSVVSAKTCHPFADADNLCARIFDAATCLGLGARIAPEARWCFKSKMIKKDGAICCTTLLIKHKIDVLPMACVESVHKNSLSGLLSGVAFG